MRSSTTCSRLRLIAKSWRRGRSTRVTTPTADLEQAAAAIAAADELALACHVRPDGDALGSALAFQHLARLHGKRTVLSWPQPSTAATHYEFLPGLEDA